MLIVRRIELCKCVCQEHYIIIIIIIIIMKAYQAAEWKADLGEG